MAKWSAAMLSSPICTCTSQTGVLMKKTIFFLYLSYWCSALYLRNAITAIEKLAHYKRWGELQNLWGITKNPWLRETVLYCRYCEVLQKLQGITKTVGYYRNCGLLQKLSCVLKNCGILLKLLGIKKVLGITWTITVTEAVRYYRICGVLQEGTGTGQG